MHSTPYIFFEGKCAEACRYYEKVLGARVTMSMTYGESPAAAHVSADLKDKIIHSALQIGNTTVMAADSPPEQWSGKPAGFALTVSVDAPEVAEKVFAGLADGGSVGMPLDKTFFAEKFGMVTDRYNIPWMVICEKALA